jgi:hypothetical protein
MTQKDWEQTSSKNVYEWRAKAVQTDRHLLAGIWETYTYKDKFGNEITEHHCLPRPSKQLINDIKKLEEKYKKKQEYFLDKSIKLLKEELKGVK